MQNIIDNFRLKREQESFSVISENIEKGVVFRGTNLWILVFAIFIASLGLNVNSTAVIIGAMLISPLMGPIMGLGLGMAINDLPLLRKAFYNYVFAAGVGLITSAVYFSITPINDAHSEILARTAPNIYDVLIAWFGGLAGILATSSRQKGNVIPGVAIATALMPPLCTAGYGLATFSMEFFFGALYLFVINTVFIALATLITARVLKFPFKHLPDKKDELKSRRIVWAIVLITLLPSIYFGYDVVRRNQFEKNARLFIQNEAVFANNYLLNMNLDAKKRQIALTFGGEKIVDDEIDELKAKMDNYGLTNSELRIQQGFTWLKDDHEQDEHTKQLTLALAEKEAEIGKLKHHLDSLKAREVLSEQLYHEIKISYPQVKSFSLQPVKSFSDTLNQTIWLSLIGVKSTIKESDRKKLESWLKVRVNNSEISFRYEK